MPVTKEKSARGSGGRLRLDRLESQPAAAPALLGSDRSPAAGYPGGVDGSTLASRRLSKLLTVSLTASVEQHLGDLAGIVVHRYMPATPEYHDARAWDQSGGVARLAGQE